ncbi:MAG: RidA family protein [Ruminococcaceae bacterium]|nr:RidA family protein [Oscillospiraceae bacterium]
MIKTVFTDKAPEAIGPYSQAKIIDNLVFTSGQIPLLPENGNVAGDDIETQTLQVIKNLISVLEAAGSNLEHVLKTTCFLQNMGDFAKFNEVYSKYFSSKPARSCVEVGKLPKDVLVEIEAVAEIIE